MPTTTIQDAIDSAAPGDTIMIDSGEYDVSGLVLPDNVTLRANGSVTLTGDLKIGGSNAVVDGFTFSGGSIDISNTEGAKIANCTFDTGTTSIHLDNAHDALIENNSFNGVGGNVIAGWGLDQSTISNNKFVDCWQPINLDFNNDPGHGRDITIESNYFTGTQRMPIEVGPQEAYTSNFVVRGNWSEDMHNAGDDGSFETDVAYSIVQMNGVNTLVEGNYAVGMGESGIGIELAGSGEVRGNYIEGFNYGTVVYGSDFHVHDNAFINTPIEDVLNYSGLNGSVENNTNDASSFAMPANPTELDSGASNGTVAESDAAVADSGMSAQDGAGHAEASTAEDAAAGTATAGDSSNVSDSAEQPQAVSDTGTGTGTAAASDQDGATGQASQGFWHGMGGHFAHLGLDTGGTTTSGSAQNAGTDGAGQANWVPNPFEHAGFHHDHHG